MTPPFAIDVDLLLDVIAESPQRAAGVRRLAASVGVDVTGCSRLDLVVRTAWAIVDTRADAEAFAALERMALSEEAA